MSRTVLFGILGASLAGCVEDDAVVGDRGAGCEGGKCDGAGDDASVVQLPIEVLGEPGFSVTVEVQVDDPSGVNRLYVQGYRLAFMDSSVNTQRGPKGSVRINGGDKINLSDDVANVFEPEASLGGIGGAYQTVRFTVPVSGIVAGTNTIEFRLDKSDGISLGYRVLDFNLKRGSKNVLPPGQFSHDDPSTWEPPRTKDKDIRVGKELWETAELRESPFSSRTLKATCADCHLHDGADLKYFNFSNASIIARAKWHGLGRKQAERIASYIRTLEGPAPAQARPWNPPYQPGPGLDAQPPEEWAAGAGLDSVLDDDGEMLEFLFPDGTGRSSIASALDADDVLNMRELPMPIQYPDWNAWLPVVHPKDAWGNVFTDGIAQAGYEKAREDLETIGVDTLIQRGDLGDTLGEIPNKTRSFIGLGSTKGNSWRVDEGEVIDARANRFGRELVKAGLAKWSAVKQFELVHEFGLAERAPEVRGKELRAWPGTAFGTFQVAPHTIADDEEHFEWQTQALGQYESNVWYQLQLTINAGQGVPKANRPIDWKYVFRHIMSYEETTGQEHPLRLIASVAKGYQEMNNGRGPAKKGWKIQETHPLWYYSTTRVENTSIIDRLESYENGLRGKLVGALIDEFVKVSASFPENDWARCAHGERGDRAFCVEPTNHTPALPEGKFFAVPKDFHADNFFRLVPLLRGKGVRASTRTALADWCEAMWPKGDWHDLAD